MKITASPMAALLARAENRVLMHFVQDSITHVHSRKRAMAEQVLAGAVPSEVFAKAAQIEGVTPAALAQLIVSKPDTLMERDNIRRSIVVQLRAATTSAQLESILDQAGIPRNSFAG